MTTVWLFDNDALYEMKRDRFRRLALENFGETASSFARLNIGFPPVPASACALGDDWLNALAAEALLLPLSLRSQPPFDSLPDTAKPCGQEAPNYGNLKNRRVSAALFPLASNIFPLLARVWAVEGADLNQSEIHLDGIGTFLQRANDNGVHLYIDCGVTPTGQSWQLAADLAIKALGARVANETRLALAAEWIITGVVENDSVEPVDIKNKLGAIQDKRRKWLYPSVNQTAFEEANESFKKKKGWFVPSATAATVTAAFRIVAGYGTRPEQSKAWPLEVKVMHALVGGNIITNLAAALICPPRELHLWHSSHREKSIQPAQNIKSILERQIPSLEGKISLHELPTHDLARAESVLEPLFASVPTEEIIYFNITSSNRMMMMAVDRFARNNPDIKLIYRDVDDPGLDYVQVWHEGGVPHTCMLRPALTTEQEKFLLELLSTDGNVAAAAIKRLSDLKHQW
jgi:hypothetical protein